MERTALVRSALACAVVVALTSVAHTAPTRMVFFGQWAEDNDVLGTLAGSPFKVEVGYDPADFVATDTTWPFAGVTHYFSRGIEGPDFDVDPPSDPNFPGIDSPGATKFLSLELVDENGTVTILPRTKIADNDGDEIMEGAPGAPVRMELVNDDAITGGIRDWFNLKDSIDLTSLNLRNGADYEDVFFAPADVIEKEFTTTEAVPDSIDALATLMNNIKDSENNWLDPFLTESNLAFTITGGLGGLYFGASPLGLITKIVVVRPGDMDCDGDVDFDDIDDLVLGLTDPNQYEDQFGIPPDLKGDTDGDGDLDFDDIPGFVDILTPSGGLQGVPEPSSLALACLAVWGAAAVGVFWSRNRRRRTD